MTLKTAPKPSEVPFTQDDCDHVTHMLEGQLLAIRKLEALGRVAARISHEINTPIQFISDNTRFIHEGFKELLALIPVVERMTSLSSPAELDAELLQETRTHLSKIDLEFLREEVPKAIEQTLDGIARVGQIMRAMKEFSHPNSDAKQWANLNQLIENTVNVSTNEWEVRRKSRDAPRSRTPPRPVSTYRA